MNKKPMTEKLTTEALGGYIREVSEENKIARQQIEKSFLTQGKPMIKLKLKDDDFYRIIVNPKKDKCPICGTALKDVGFTWNIMHGEATASCCGAIYQIKSWWVDEEKEPELHKFAESLDSPDRIYLKIKDYWIKPLQKAMSELNTKRLNNDVYQLAEQILQKKQSNEGGKK